MRLNFYSCGEGFPLIVLHGLLGSSDNWQSLSKQFSEHFRVFALDLRNHGASPHSDGFDYPAMAGDLGEFMDSQGIKEAFLMGHSMGGKTSMQFAAQYPDRVRKLISADIGIKRYPLHHTKILDALWSVDLKGISSRSDLDKALAAQLPDAALRAFLMKNVKRDEQGLLNWKINLQVIREKYGNIAAALELPAPFGKPTLFMRGAHSDYVVPADESGIREYFPSAKFVTLEGAGHWLHAERPEEFADEVLKFLTAPV